MDNKNFIYVFISVLGCILDNNSIFNLEIKNLKIKFI